MTPRSDEPLEPPLRITDRRRFANLDDTGDVTPASGSEAGVAPAPVEPEAAATSEDLEAARTEATQHLDHLRRLQAEFDNYRKRVKREMTEAQERGAEPVVRRLLEVLDDFELALMHAGEKPDFDRFLHGVELVYAKLARRPEGRRRRADGGRGPAVRPGVARGTDADGRGRR